MSESGIYEILAAFGKYQYDGHDYGIESPSHYWKRMVEHPQVFDVELVADILDENNGHK